MVGGENNGKRKVFLDRDALKVEWLMETYGDKFEEIYQFYITSVVYRKRFDKENGGGNLFTDAAEMTRDEIKFHNFIMRLRSNFKEIIVKPLKIGRAHV